MIDTAPTTSQTYSQQSDASAVHTDRYLLRTPARRDGYDIWQLISACPPLDLNSVYSYLLLCEHFDKTCVVAETDGQIDGFVSAYQPPGRDDVLFIWQVAVHERGRGHGLGQRMLTSLLERPNLAHVRSLETTVGPDNAASRRMFAAVARNMGAGIEESPLFEPELFGPQAHDDERLLKIGPLRPTPG
ncbi:diaminobutyrate acetyltransferase [Advenella sp. S44]|uniref:diaminobutyrate acetyltransferase n=1 Tax=Advenella sp. S44 TaxID=1982755 RepID=UPI000C2AE013|nr:diaminobutyrate acetyltransferase [Advenella sp. S44]PJX23385.1 diaminobutyrate acetyltransferase [Advenella sp. S44]